MSVQDPWKQTGVMVKESQTNIRNSNFKKKHKYKESQMFGWSFSCITNLIKFILRKSRKKSYSVSKYYMIRSVVFSKQTQQFIILLF